MARPKGRVRHLRDMIQGAEERMLRPECTDQNFAVLGRFRRDLLAELDELTGGNKNERTGLSEFERKLREREQQRNAGRAGSAVSGGASG